MRQNPHPNPGPQQRPQPAAAPTAAHASFGTGGNHIKILRYPSQLLRLWPPEPCKLILCNLPAPPFVLKFVDLSCAVPQVLRAKRKMDVTSCVPRTQTETLSHQVPQLLGKIQRSMRPWTTPATQSAAPQATNGDQTRYQTQPRTS